MKKIFLLIIATATMLSCSSDDSSGASVNSTLTIDGAAFTPTTMTTFQGPALEEYSIRNFLIAKGNQKMILSFSVPLGASETGTYSLGLVNMGERYASGSYSVDNSQYYSIIGDDIQLEAMGSNKYKITFNNTEIKNFNNQNEVLSLSGSVEGTFKVGSSN